MPKNGGTSIISILFLFSLNAFLFCRAGRSFIRIVANYKVLSVPCHCVHVRHPSRDDHEWAKDDVIGDKSVFIALPIPEQLYIAVRAFGGDAARYSLSTRIGVPLFAL